MCKATGIIVHDFFTTTGIITYGDTYINSYLDNSIGCYYRSLVPKHFYLKSPKTPSHISIVRSFEKPNKILWGKYEGKTIKIQYGSILYTDQVYVWLDAWSDTIGDIREEIGLDRFRIRNSYHITIGNFK